MRFAAGLGAEPTQLTFTSTGSCSNAGHETVELEPSSFLDVGQPPTEVATWRLLGRGEARRGGQRQSLTEITGRPVAPQAQSLAFTTPIGQTRRCHSPGSTRTDSFRPTGTAGASGIRHVSLHVNPSE